MTNSKTNPTLIIGLGGTGRQTLMQIRRLFLEDDPYFLPQDKEVRDTYRKQYPPGRVPHVELLSIDTDERLLDLNGERFDSVLEAAALGGNEVLDIKIVAEKVAALYREPNAHPNYRDWYDFSLQAAGLPEHGCGQTRPWGRLAFFHNEGDIAARIKSAIERLLGQGARDAASKIGVDLDNDTIKVQLVFSVAGGTGSGMFLDTAFLIRKICAELARVTLILEAVILLPTAFSNSPKHRVFANAYAALMEIEYYNRQRETDARDGWFQVLWESEYDGRKAPRRLFGPTFDIAWLIDNKSRGLSVVRGGTRLGVDKGDKSALTGMMAEWLYRRCTPADETFGNNINSYVIGNALPQECSATAQPIAYEGDALDPVDGGYDFSRRFGSFGLSKIHAPSSLAQERLAHRLVADMIGDWLHEPALDMPIIAAELQGARRALNLVSDLEPLDADAAPMDMRVFALSRSIDHAKADRSLLDAVKEEVEAGRSLVSEADDFERSFLEWRRGFRQQKVSDEDPALNKKGDFARNVIEFSERREREDVATLDGLLTRYLREQGRGFGFARGVLDGLKNDYDHVIAEAGAAMENENEAGRDYERRATDTVPFHEGSAFVRGVVARVCLNHQRDAFLAEIGRQIYGHTIRLASAMSRIVSERIRELEELQLELLRLRTEVEQTAAQLEQRPHSKLNRLIVVQRDDRYRTENGRDLAKADTRWSLLASSPAPDGPWPVRQQMFGAARATFRGRFIDFAKDRLDHVLRERTWVLSVFDKEMTDNAKYQTALRPLVDNATSWLDVRHETGRHWEAAKPIGLHRVAARQGSPAEQDRLLDQLRQLGFNNGVTQFDHLTAPVDQLLFEEHLTGVPLFEVASLRPFRDQAYEPIMAGVTDGMGEIANAALHLERDVDKYSDLLRPDAAEAERRRRAMELFLRGLIFGILEGRRDERTSTILFSYQKDIGLKKRAVELGRHPKVVRILARERSADSEQITSELQVLEERIWNESTDRRAQVLALLDHYANGTHALGSNRQLRRVAGDRFNLLRQRVDKGTLDVTRTELEPTLTSWSEEVPPNSGLRRLIL